MSYRNLFCLNLNTTAHNVAWRLLCIVLITGTGLSTDNGLMVDWKNDENEDSTVFSTTWSYQTSG